VEPLFVKEGFAQHGFLPRSINAPSVTSQSTDAYRNADTVPSSLRSLPSVAQDGMGVHSGTHKVYIAMILPPGVMAERRPAQEPR